MSRRWKAEDLNAQQREMIASSWRGQPVGKGGAKFKAKEAWVDNIRFDSELEASHYSALKLLKAGGVIKGFVRQITFLLPGGVKHRVDWLVWAERHGFAESKGYDLPMGRMKRKQVEELYSAKIHLFTTPNVIPAEFLESIGAITREGAVIHGT
jgi:hypothetical protein